MKKKKKAPLTKKELYARYPGFYKDFSSNYTKCIEEVLDYNARRRDRAVADYLSWDHIDLKRHFPSIKDSNALGAIRRALREKFYEEAKKTSKWDKWIVKPELQDFKSWRKTFKNYYEDALTNVQTNMKFDEIDEETNNSLENLIMNDVEEKKSEVPFGISTSSNITLSFSVEHHDQLVSKIPEIKAAVARILS
jgi:hypothetical protein|tara:strand:- start:26576 stop:27157 length:582 start_codon:yes stop_codon:yes gene_type:complete